MTKNPQPRQNVSVDAEALKEFRAAVLVAHGRLYDKLGREATIAIRERALRLRRDGA